ncbi:helix-turn-helix domain-containing protein [Afifella sp. YEN Y35]|uniref:helix-turn-helix domain-containing protein n=1 Tax=Afifella sp. YEN Y35 TaxID=3388337 RepID=UPI0039DF746F
MSGTKFDGDAFFASLDAERQSRRLTWKKVAQEAEVSPSTLTRISQGRRPDVDSLAALCTWSGLKADQFVRSRISADGSVSSLAQITTYLRADPLLSKEGADALETLIKTAYERLRKE